MRRPVTLASSCSAAEVRPGSAARPLPPFSPAPPERGWTLDAAAVAAVNYAESLAHRPDLGTRGRLARAAFSAILRSVPGLLRAEAGERLSGRDVLAQALRIGLDTTKEPGR